MFSLSAPFSLEQMLNVGIIGLGVGEAHIHGYQNHPGCRVTTLCDFQPSVLERMRIKYPDMKFVSNPMEVLADRSIQVVSIASYDNFHHSQIMAGIAYGKHLFVEKPLCLYESEAKQISLALNQKPELKISSNLILRKSPRFIDLKNRIQQGKMGSIFHIEGDYNYGRIQKIVEGWRGKLDFYSIILGGGVHLIDLMQWLTGDIVEFVSAFGNNISTRNSQFRFDDTIVSILKFRSGMTGKMTANFSCVHPHFHPLAVYGTEATFINGRAFGELYTSRDSAREPERLETPYPGTQKGDFLYNFIEAILGDQEPEVTRDEIFRSLAVCFAIDRAVAESRVIEVSTL